tara:strand:+ start:244 stop:663 length:420 start_codon:yes stop_codon:yes gene_type:complete
MNRKLYIDKDLDKFIGKCDVMKRFINFCSDKLEINCDFKVFIVEDREHHGVQTTAYYDPNIKLIKIYGKDRAIVDVLRSIAHEMTHMRQDINGEITGPVQDIGGYHENQANAMSGALIKMFAKSDQDGRMIYEGIKNKQ